MPKSPKQHEDPRLCPRAVGAPALYTCPEHWRSFDHTTRGRQLMGSWQPIETAPRDGTWFLIAIKSGGRWTYEAGHYDPLIQSRYVEAGDGLYRREEYSAYDWCGFNNMHAALCWKPIDPPEQS